MHKSQFVTALRVALWIVASASPCLGDVIHLKGGSQFEGVVIQQGTERVCVLQDACLLNMGRSMIDHIVLTQPPDPSEPPKVQAAASLPTWLEVLKGFAVEAWSEGLKQVPATVIDEGILKNVPYKSRRCGQYEFNVYGDPDAPAGFELGVYGPGTTNEKVKKACLIAVAKLLRDVEFSNTVISMNVEQDSKTVRGVSFEVTPATAKDAYGGWWISVYDESLLEKSRASDKELASITVALPQRSTSSSKRVPPPARSPTTSTRKNATLDPSPAPPPSGQPERPSTLAPTPVPVPAAWQEAELKTARPPMNPAGGTVFVRGYVRKDGTYVGGYTRRAPSKR